MANSIIVTKVGEKEPEFSLEEKKALLEAYKIKNPIKFAKKEANGEFKKFLGEVKNVKEEIVKEPEVAGDLAEAAPRRGRPPLK